MRLFSISQLNIKKKLYACSKLRIVCLDLILILNVVCEDWNGFKIILNFFRIVIYNDEYYAEFVSVQFVNVYYPEVDSHV